MCNVKHGIIPPSGFRISSSPFRTPSVNASRLLAAGLYLQKTFAYFCLKFRKGTISLEIDGCFT